MTRIASINQDRGIEPGRSKGAAVHLQAMRQAFSRLGCHVMAFDQPEPARLERELVTCGEHAFDLIYERYALGCDTGARFARSSGTPFVLEVNAPLADEALRFRGTEETAEDRQRDEFLFQQAHCVVAVSTAVAKYARQRGARPEVIHVCPNGIDTRRFNLSVSGQTVRNAKLPAGAMVIGFHGRLRPWHGFEHLVSVAGQMLANQVSVHLLTVGHGDFSAAGRLPGRAWTHLSWQAHEHMPEIVAAFDVLPLTYPPDLPCYFSPLKLMEAMACGVVPVVPDLGDLAHLVRHDRAGLVYPAGDLDRLGDLLTSLARNPEQRQRLGLEAAEVARGYSWDRIAGDILAWAPPSTGIARVVVSK